jgi:hypothetical protein
MVEKLKAVKTKKETSKTSKAMRLSWFMMGSLEN